MYVKSHKIYSRDYQDDGESRFSPYDCQFSASGYPPWMGQNIVILGVNSPVCLLTCVFLSFSSASHQRKSPQGKGKRRSVPMMKSPAAPRLQRSLLNRPRTHKQVRDYHLLKFNKGKPPGWMLFTLALSHPKIMIGNILYLYAGYSYCVSSSCWSQQ